MDIIMGIVICTFIVLFFFYLIGSATLENKQTVTSTGKSEAVKITQSSETDTHIQFTIDIKVDKYDSHQFFCKIDKIGSPWVTVEATHYDEPGDIYDYNARHSRWKDRDKPFYIEKGMRKATRLIREQWNTAKENYGWTFAKKEPKSGTVNISTKQIDLKYEEHSLDKLPEKIKLQGGDEIPYLINLKTLTCTCSDFTKRRSEFPDRDIRRICKHQAKAIMQSKLNTKITKDLKIQNIIRRSQGKGFRVFEQCIQATFNEQGKKSDPFYLFFEESNDWVNVIYFTARSYIRSGYNITEKRWAHNTTPFPNGSIRKYKKAMEKTLTRLK